VLQREGNDDAHTFGQDSLYELVLATGDAIELLRLPNQVLGFAWSPDGARLAYQLRTETPGRVGPRLLCMFDARSGEASLLRSIPRPFGTGTGQREETSVDWSPDGRFILAVETAAEASLFVVDIDGRDAVTPRDGTFGRWLTEGSLLFQRDHPRNNEDPGDWRVLSVPNGGTSPFNMPPGYRPAVSPDGDKIAFDDGDGAEPSIFVFDVDDGTTQRLARGFVAPVWLGPDQIAATAAGPCPSGSFCPIPWSFLGTTAGIDVSTGDRTTLALPSTLQEVPRYGVIDVLLP
jgi:WD40 repeat protein